MSQHTRPVRWPLGLWLVQLIVPGSVLAYGLLRWVKGPPLTQKVSIAVAVCAVWCSVVVMSLAVRSVRQGLVSRRRQLALGLGSTLLALIACDVALSITGIVPSIAELRLRSLEYQRTAFTRHRLGAKHLAIDAEHVVTINSRGYLGPEITMPKPAGTTRLIFLGGSHVYGVCWADGQDWPTQVGQVLREDGYNVDVINAGIPNHQTGDGVGKLFADLWLTEPDVVVVCNTWNDIKYFAELTPERPYLHVAAPTIGQDPRLYPTGIDRVMCLSAFYRIIHGRLITALYGVGDEGERLREPVMQVTDVALRQYRLNLQTICDIAKNIGAKAVLCKQARLPVADSSDADRERIPYDFTGLAHNELIRALTACDRIIDEVAAEKGATVIDMSGPLSGKAQLFADHIHFNGEGSQQAARLVARELEPILPPQGGQPEDAAAAAKPSAR